MGLLDFSSLNDPQTMGLLSLAASIGAASGPSVGRPNNLAAGILGGLGQYQDVQNNALKQKLTQAQLDDIVQQAAMRKMQVDAMMRNQAMLDPIFQKIQRSLSGAPDQGGLPMYGPGATTMRPETMAGGPIGVTQPQQQDPIAGLSPTEQLVLNSALGGTTDTWKFLRTPHPVAAGSYNVNPATGQSTFMPKPGEPSFDAQGNVVLPSGTENAVGRLTGTQEAAKQEQIARATPAKPEDIIAGNKAMSVWDLLNPGKALTPPGMPPIQSSQPSMKVAPEAQAARDAERVKVLSDELAQATNPVDRAAIQREIDSTANGKAYSTQTSDGQPKPPPGMSLKQWSETVTKAKQEYGPALTQAQTMADTIDRLGAEAKAIRDNPALGRITGVTGMFPNMPGSKATGVAARYETLRAQTVFATLASIRAASPTGGALGQISNFEDKLLSDAIAGMNKAQSEGDMKGALDRIIQYTDGARNRIKTSFDNSYKPILGNSYGFKEVPSQNTGGAGGTWGFSPSDIDAELKRRGG